MQFFWVDLSLITSGPSLRDSSQTVYIGAAAIYFARRGCVGSGKYTAISAKVNVPHLRGLGPKDLSTSGLETVKHMGTD